MGHEIGFFHFLLCVDETELLYPVWLLCHNVAGGVPAEAPLTSTCLGLVSLPLIFGGLLAPIQKDIYSEASQKTTQINLLR